MQTLTVHFSSKDMDELKDAIRSLKSSDGVTLDILHEKDLGPCPGTDYNIIKVEIMFVDPNALFSLGLIVGMTREHNRIKNYIKTYEDE